VMGSVAVALRRFVQVATDEASKIVPVSPRTDEVSGKSAANIGPAVNEQPVPLPIGSPMIKLDVAPPYQLVRARQGWMLCNVNDFYMGKAICTYGECCEIEAQFLLRLASFGGMVVEVGANMGIFTVPLAKFLAGQGRRMLAFEPQPVIHQQLSANLALNGLMNVTALPYACGAETGSVTFPAPDYLRPGNFGGISMGVQALPAGVHVPCVRLDDMTEGQQVGLIKIDVEGFELNVLKGATAVIQRCRPIIYLENDRVDHSRSLIEWLWATGFKVWWHAPRLFNPNNYFGVTENLYSDVASFNMLAVPSERAGEIPELPLVTDSGFHPLAPKPPGE